MDENFSSDYLLDDSELLLSDCHRNNSNFTFENNQQYDPSPEPFTSNDKSIWEGYDLTFNATLDYISKILVEEDIDEKCCPYEDEAALHATDKIFYDILGQKYPSLPGKTPSVGNIENSGDNTYSSCGEWRNSSNESVSTDFCPSDK